MNICDWSRSFYHYYICFLSWPLLGERTASRWAMSSGWLSGLTGFPQRRSLGCTPPPLPCVKWRWIYPSHQDPQYPPNPPHRRHSISLEGDSVLACLGVLVANTAVSGVAVMGWRWEEEGSAWRDCTSSVHRTSIKTLISVLFINLTFCQSWLQRMDVYHLRPLSPVSHTS